MSRAHLARHILSAALAVLAAAEFSLANSPADTKVVAHRGLLLEAPENTLANFRACLELGLGFEVDVQRSSDGHLVAVHDATVDRTTNGTGRVSEKTLAELRGLDAGSWFDEKYRGQRIPTIDEVFALVSQYPQPSILIAVDFKGADAKIEADLVALANRHGVRDRLLMIGRAISMPEVRTRLHAADPKVHCGRVANTPDEFAASLNDEVADWVYVRYVPSHEEVEQVHARGKRVFIAGSTVSGNQPQNWRRCTSRAVDAILTDYSLELARQLRHDRHRVDELEALITPHYTPPAEFRDAGKFASPLERTDGSRIDSRDAWLARRQEVRELWIERLGGWPELLKEPRIKIVATTRREEFTQHQVEVEVYSGEKFTEGHLLIPDGPGPFPAALVTFYDSRTSIGLGPKGKGTHDYGLQLVRRGLVTLSIATPGSLEVPGKSTRDLLTAAGEEYECQPLGYLAHVAANCHTALARHPQVDPDRIGVVGLSYGGKWSLFASCLYDKFAAAVWSDPGIVFNEQNANVNYWEPWYLGYEAGTRRPPGVPNQDRPRTGLYKQMVEQGEDLTDLHALICLRPVLLAGGTEDPPSNWRVLNNRIEINQLYTDEPRVAMTHRPTHVPTPEALQRTLAFLEYHLKFR